jgi:glycosyltransferase involved in cell wall biosynthesis
MSDISLAETTQGFHTIYDILPFIEKANWHQKYDKYDAFFESAFLKDKTAEELEVSIVVISWKDNPALRTALDSIVRQENVRKEIIFVNNGAGESLSWCRDYSDIYICLNTNTGAYLSRNIGAMFSRANIILFLEDDGVSDPYLASSHFNIHDEMPEVVSTRGICLPVNNNNINNAQNHYYLGPKVVSSIPNLEGNCAFKRRPFLEVDGWDDDIKFGHGGLDIASRLYKKYPDVTKFIYIPHALLTHDYASSEASLLEKRKKQVEGMRYLQKKNPSISRVHELTLQHDTEIAVPTSIVEEIQNIQRRINRLITKYENSRKHIIGQRDTSKFELLHQLSESYEIVAIGAGSLGERFAALCDKNDIQIACFFDRNAKISNVLHYPVYSNIVFNKQSVVVITTSFVESAQEDLKQFNNQLIGHIFVFR